MQNFDARQKARSEEVDALNEATMAGKTGEDTRYQGMHFRYYIYIYIYIYMPGTLGWPLFLKVNPTKQGLFHSKQGSFGFGFQVSKSTSGLMGIFVRVGGKYGARTAGDDGLILTGKKMDKTWKNWKNFSVIWKRGKSTNLIGQVPVVTLDEWNLFQRLPNIVGYWEWMRKKPHTGTVFVVEEMRFGSFWRGVDGNISGVTPYWPTLSWRCYFCLNQHEWIIQIAVARIATFLLQIGLPFFSGKTHRQKHRKQTGTISTAESPTGATLGVFGRPSPTFPEPNFDSSTGDSTGKQRDDNNHIKIWVGH